jgi:hypothetical protein
MGMRGHSGAKSVTDTIRIVRIVARPGCCVALLHATSLHHSSLVVRICIIGRQIGGENWEEAKSGMIVNLYILWVDWTGRSWLAVPRERSWLGGKPWFVVKEGDLDEGWFSFSVACLFAPLQELRVIE